jgi:hypothetical protein
MYLRIVNPSVCPVEGFTVLGVSSARDKAESIGEFGSGNKHGVNVCLRNNINPIIFCGLKRLEFFTQPEMMGETSYNRVYVKVSNRKPERLSMSAEYGQKDWKDIGMALREFVSNALDAAGGDAKKVKIDIVPKITGRQDKTVIGIPLTPQVQEWFNELPLRFLHFRQDSKERLTKKLQKKRKPNQCKVYRKGVLVRAEDPEKTAPSLFDYNLGDELDIDEARNLSESHIKDQVATTVATNKEALVEIFKAFREGKHIWENTLPEWELKYYGSNRLEMWQDAWKEANGDAIVAGDETLFANLARQQGNNVIVVHHANWYNAIRNVKIRTVIDVLENVNGKGDIIKPPTATDQAVLDQIWDWFTLLDMTRNKEKPELLMYERVQTDDIQTHGYVHDDKVHILEEQRATHQVYVEEVAHYVTGSLDCTRAFQEFAFKLATKMGLLMDT